jgi:hypothetical protein
MICLEMHDEVDILHVERSHLVGCSYLDIIDFLSSKMHLSQECLIYYKC